MKDFVITYNVIALGELELWYRLNNNNITSIASDK